jgi:hypothetical protein
VALTEAGRIAAAAASFAAVAVLAARAKDGGRLARADRMAFDRVRASRHQAGVAVAEAVSALAEPGVVYPVLGLAGAAAVAADRLAEGRHAGPGSGRRCSGPAACLPGGRPAAAAR